MSSPFPLTATRLWAAVVDDEGAATAEYAIATMAAVGLAGLLVAILKGDAVKTILTDLITRALTFAG
jgi:Flp pilus assembly pilin Flp